MPWRKGGERELYNYDYRQIDTLSKRKLLIDFISPIVITPGNKGIRYLIRL